MKKHPAETVHEIVAVFQDPDKLQVAVQDLQSNGFMHHEISVLSDKDTVREKIGHAYHRVQNAEDDPQAPRALYIPTENVSIARGFVVAIPMFAAASAAAIVTIASSGTVADAIIYAAVAGAVGAGLGSMLATLIAKQRAEYLQDQINHGGLLLWVNLRSTEMEKRAKKILRKYAAQDIHVHDIPLTKQ